MARKRLAYQKKKHNRFGMFLATLCLLLVLIAVGVRGSELKKKQHAYEARVKALKEQIAEETVRTGELAEYEKYTKTDAFVEEIAKQKLGLVFEGEIIFKSGS